MVFGLFSKERSIQRAMKKATNKLAQSPDRWAAMQKLLDHGSEDALYVLCKRFSITSTKGIEDQQEKQWVVEVLTAKGQDALPAVHRYLIDTDGVSFPLRILENIATPEQALKIADEIFEKEPPGYTRDPNKKIDTINWLGEYRAASDKDVVTRIVPYLADFDENVRFAAVESIGLRPTQDASQGLVDALLNPEEESRRLKLRIAEIICDAELDLCGRKDEVAGLFDDYLEGYRLHRDKLVKKLK